jgi:hypothetical protein
MRRIASFAQGAMLPGEKAIFAKKAALGISGANPREPRPREFIKRILIQTSAFMKNFNFKLTVSMRIF